MRTDESITEDIQEAGTAEELPPSHHMSNLVQSWLLVVPASEQKNT